uniref:Spermatosis associated 22 n=1 Tax=Leptobrachium leishanense TaxID=445787 RepID=A0A8C5LX15_9ANUR
MKRSSPPSTTPRASSGYLPVPIFNQKKRCRQPLTSVPQQNEPGPSCFQQTPEGFLMEKRIPQPINFVQKSDTGLPMSHRLQHYSAHQQYKFSPSGGNTGLIEKKQAPWPQDEFAHLTTRRLLNSKPCNENFGSLKQPNAFSFHSESKFSDTSPPTSAKPLYSCGTLSRTRNTAFKNTAKISKDLAFADMPEDEMIQSVPLYQMTVNEKENSLRILPSCIESMKHWSDYSDRIPLLFEVFATLDSAVISGDHGSKSFLLRDGKSHVPCVFYEIDRELPRLVRGHIHRSVGNYDRKRNLLKCVSVRPASISEQQTFKEFINAANEEMGRYTKTMHEV